MCLAVKTGKRFNKKMEYYLHFDCLGFRIPALAISNCVRTLIHDSFPDTGYKEGSERVGLQRFSQQSFVFVSKKIMIKINLKKKRKIC